MNRTHNVVMAAVATCGLVWSVRATGDDWPQWRGPQRDGVWRETGLLEKFPDRQLQWKWHVPIGTGYCGPTVAAGRVYVMDRQQDPEQERVLCFDADTGRELWRHAYDCEYQGVSYTAGPRASVTLADGQAYSLGTMGHLHCLEATSGQVVWRRDMGADFQIRLPQWGMAAAPLIHRDLVIVQIGGRGGACVVALDRQSGRERWRALDDRAGYSAPILLQRADTTVCVAWTGDSIAGLDADRGDVLWRLPFAPRKMPIGVATPVVDGDRLFVSSFYDGSFMVQLGETATQARKLWSEAGPSERETAALHCMISTPIMRDGLIWGVDSYGELRCLEAATGRRLWEEDRATPRARWSNIHMVVQEDRVWMFNERGELIICRLTRAGFEEISRAQLIEPTTDQLSQRGGVCWSHPAYANRHVFARNDRELVCASLAKEPAP